MALVWLIIPEMCIDADERPQLCPFCGHHILQRWGKFSRIVHDLSVEELELHRYRCERCRRTFRYYPRAVDQADPTPRIRKAAGVAWAMGMSARQVVELFQLAGIHISRMAVWREGQALLGQLDCREDAGGQKPYALDAEYVPGASSKLGTVVGIQFGGARSFVLGTVDETSPFRLVDCLQDATADVDIKVVLQKGSGALSASPSFRESVNHSSPDNNRIRSQGGKLDSSARIERNS